MISIRRAAAGSFVRHVKSRVADSQPAGQQNEGAIRGSGVSVVTAS
jgi:hypothetical protein